MDKIKQWSLTVSAVSVIGGILLSLVPGGKLKPSYKTLISILLVYTFMLPFVSSLSIDFDIENYLKDNYKVSESFDKYALENAVSSAEKAVKEALSDYFKSQKIQCDFDVECESIDGEIVIKSIYISCNEKKDIIISMMSELGFEKNYIKFKGETDEH